MITTKSYPRVIREAALLAMAGQFETMSEHRSVPPVVPDWQGSSAIVGYVDSLPVGVMVLTDWEQNDALYVHLTYVLPEQRRKGVARIMFLDAISEARRLGRAHIRSTTAASNKTMRLVAGAMGRVEESVNLRYDVPTLGAANER